MATMTAPDRLARRAASLTALIVALALGGCAAGGDEGGAPPASGNDTAAPADPATDESGEDAAEEEADEGDTDGGAVAVSGVGDVIFGLTAYDVEEVINCDTALYGDNSVVVDDITASGRAENGDFMRLFIQRQDISGAVVSYLDYQGPEGLWSSNDGNAIIQFTDSGVSGTVTVLNDAGDASDLVQFEFDVPSELTDCS